MMQSKMVTANPIPQISFYVTSYRKNKSLAARVLTWGPAAGVSSAGWSDPAGSRTSALRTTEGSGRLSTNTSPGKEEEKAARLCQ
ncbi:jg20809 [Pararge aegeria aegeria]|uniref:Jg20809 protein n=1 Tax=Pararge aegeria aegeria TaxID=348720 RepID=A0A8S4R5Q2_9NEOP|nr:jg20809 [Pararge aegeria aegeria]